jgi:hypothetical protein
LREAERSAEYAVVRDVGFLDVAVVFAVVFVVAGFAVAVFVVVARLVRALARAFVAAAVASLGVAAILMRLSATREAHSDSFRLKRLSPV